ncbi:MAG TPA: AAA family ATPase, partial [Phycisphaerae bacterium]|nr:AAA family ATPase [Phycisphaerae bacterium]
GTPRPLVIDVRGIENGEEWGLAMEFVYRYPDLVHVRPARDAKNTESLAKAKQVRIVHVPPFSGIGPEETRYDGPYQDLLVGQGKPGDILRNLLLEVHEEKPREWQHLCDDIRDIFGYTLEAPVYEGRPFILCEYQPGIPGPGDGPLPKLDISCAGSGFLQVLMLLGFFYSRPASVLLLDEPDAHLHVILQKQVYDRLRSIARERECQLLIATHSEVLVDGTSPEQILTFFRKPHLLVSRDDRDRLREALRGLTSQDVLMSDQARNVLYVEGETDLNLLREWAKVLEHPTYEQLREPFWRANRGSRPQEARRHFFALKAVNPRIRGVLLLDGDNRSLPDHEIADKDLLILRWGRYEAESYLLHPEVLCRFVERRRAGLFGAAAAEKGMRFLREELPPAVLRDPTGEHDYLNATPASKTILPGFFEAAEFRLSKNEYYQVASEMKPEEVPPEVRQKLDQIGQVLGA